MERVISMMEGDFLLIYSTSISESLPKTKPIIIPIISNLF